MKEQIKNKDEGKIIQKVYVVSTEKVDQLLYEKTDKLYKN